MAEVPVSPGGQLTYTRIRTRLVELFVAETSTFDEASTFWFLIGPLSVAALFNASVLIASDQTSNPSTDGGGELQPVTVTGCGARTRALQVPSIASCLGSQMKTCSAASNDQRCASLSVQSEG
jgi:hypothetical protein